MLAAGTEDRRGRIVASADQVPVQVGAGESEALRDREEHDDRIRPDLQREDLAHRQVAGAGARGCEEEDYNPAESLRRRVQRPSLEQLRRDHQQDARVRGKRPIRRQGGWQWTW